MNDSEALYHLLRAQANEQQRGPMEQYMKHHFPFFGIKRPQLESCWKSFLAERPHLKQQFDQTLVEQLYIHAERECHYIALAYVRLMQKTFTVKDEPFFRALVMMNSWWDSVDTIASIMGDIVRRDQQWQAVMDDWSASPNMWLSRVALLHQLKWKKETDFSRLFRYVEENKGSEEFFLQKAIGWALREYAKYEPERVMAFIASAKLAPLSKREAEKHLKVKMMK